MRGDCQSFCAGFPQAEFDPVESAPALVLSTSGTKTVAAFQAECMRLGFTTYVRKTRGDDIDAACGQFAAENDPAPVVNVGQSAGPFLIRRGPSSVT